MDEAAVQGTASYGSLLRNRNYSLLWLGQLVSLFGDKLHQIGVVVLVGALTANNLGQIGLLFVVIVLPELLFGLFAGALVDRWDRRRVMIASDLVRLFLVASLPFLAGVGIFWVYVVTFLLTTVTLFFRPAKNATIPAIVPPSGLMPANSLSESTENLMDVLGYPIAGAIIAGLAWLAGDSGISLIFYIDAATYGFSALMIYKMSVTRVVRPEQTGAALRGLLRSVAEGLRYLRSNAPLLTNTGLSTLAILLFLGTWTLSYGYATEVTGTGAFGYSMLEAGIGIGALVGGLAVGRWGGRFPKGPTILVGLVVMGISMASLALFANLWLAVGMLALGGVGNMLYLIPSITLVQGITPEEFLGRVFSLCTVLMSTTTIAANALAGVAAELFGVQPVLGLLGVLLIALGLLAFLLPSARNVD